MTLLKNYYSSILYFNILSFNTTTILNALYTYCQVLRIEQTRYSICSMKLRVFLITTCT